MFVDTHFHGPIGFQKFLIDRQGYQGKNHLKEIIDICMQRNVDMCAITSEEFNIPRRSIHDRFGYLLAHYAEKLPLYYSVKPIGDNISIIDKGYKRLRLINSQTIISMEEDKRVDGALILFSNEAPSKESLQYGLEWSNERGLPIIAEHPIFTSHFGIGHERLKMHSQLYDSIEGHNAQLFVSSSIARLLPPLKRFSQSINERAKSIAKELCKPYTAASDGHRIEDAGIAGIDMLWPFTRAQENHLTEDQFKATFKKILRSGKFTPIEDYISPLNFVKWNIVAKAFRDEYARNPAVNEIPEQIE